MPPSQIYTHGLRLVVSQPRFPPQPKQTANSMPGTPAGEQQDRSSSCFARLTIQFPNVTPFAAVLPSYEFAV